MQTLGFFKINLCDNLSNSENYRDKNKDLIIKISDVK